MTNHETFLTNAPTTTLQMGKVCEICHLPIEPHSEVIEGDNHALAHEACVDALEVK